MRLANLRYTWLRQWDTEHTTHPWRFIALTFSVSFGIGVRLHWCPESMSALLIVGPVTLQWGYSQSKVMWAPGV